MKILGIDPGTATVGYGLIKKDNGPLEYIDCGHIQTDKTSSPYERINEIANDFTSLLEIHHPDILAIEKLYFGKNVTNAIKVAEVRGVILYLATKRNMEIREFSPNEVKSIVTGDGKADKLQMQKMVKILLKLKSIPKPDDAADGLAIALSAALTNTTLQ